MEEYTATPRAVQGVRSSSIRRPTGGGRRPLLNSAHAGHLVAHVVGVARISLQQAAAADILQTLPLVLHRILEGVFEGILAEGILAEGLLEGVFEGIPEEVLQRILEHVVSGTLEKIKIEAVLGRLGPPALRREVRRLGRLR